MKFLAPEGRRAGVQLVLQHTGIGIDPECVSGDTIHAVGIAETVGGVRYNARELELDVVGVIPA
jgi:hypothetical protein